MKDSNGNWCGQGDDAMSDSGKRSWDRWRVSVCVIAYNESKYMHQLLDDLALQTYPHRNIEIILVDGASADDTKTIMRSFALGNRDFYSIKVLDNPKRIQAAGWNVAIGESSGDVIIRIDAHTHIPPEFVEKNIKNIDRGEYISGGLRPCMIDGTSLWSKTLLQVENSLFGSSIGKSKHGRSPTYVKTMFHAAYRREVFAAVGGFNENLERTEDNELHYRIRKAGFKFFFDPEIVSYQYARNSLKRMIKQKYANGYWIGLTLGVCPGCISLYHLVPFMFIVGIVLTGILAIMGVWAYAVIMWLSYIILALVNAGIVLFANEFNLLYLTMPFLYPILHISYGAGTFMGIVKIPFQYRRLANCETINLVKNKVNSSNGAVDEDHIH